MFWLALICFAFAVFGLAVDARQRKRRQEAEFEKRSFEAARRAAELARLRQDIVTSSTSIIHGWHVKRHIRLICIADQPSKDEAERVFLREVKRAGANGVFNMVIRAHKGGVFTAQGNAVILDDEV